MRFPSLFAAAVLAAAPSLHAGTSAYRNTVLADTPIAYWEMDETAGGTIAADSAGTPQPGTYQNVTLGLASAFPNLGTSGQFNGTTSRVRVEPDNVFNLGTGDFTVEAWAKTPVTSRGDVFNYKNSTDFGIFLNNSGAGSIGAYLNGFLPTYTATVNAWYHIVVTRTGGTGRLYVNGIERGTAAAASSFSANAPVFIGSNHTGAPGYTMTIPFNGWIDEVAVYGTALSAVRVLDHYNAAQAVPSGSPAVTNSPATIITSTGARLGGTVTDPGSSTPAVTIYYGNADAGASLVAWDSSISAGNQTGAFTVDVSGLAANTQHYFRCYAQNAAGGNWASPSLTFTTPPGLPAVENVAAANVLAASATIGATVTVTGGSTTTVTLFHGTADAGTAAASWQSSVSLGAQTGTATANLTNLNPGTTYYFRARATNAGSTVWATVTATFTTPSPSPPVVVNLTPENITIFWATLRGEVTSTGFAPPDVTIHWGPADGGTNVASWANAASIGSQSGAFFKLVTGLAPSTTYYYRARAVNMAGTAWAPATQSFTTPATSALEAVINEIHCDHEDKTLRVEFIELYNPGATALDLTGWYFDKGVDFTFPYGASIPPGGYAVVAENPAVLQSTYGYAGTYGPWNGSLQANGETITLKNPSGEVVDEVDYELGFPWPTVGVAPNYSHELINPSLDNSLGGNWRRSDGTAVGLPENIYVAAASKDWKYFKALTEPSTPADAWREPGFDDASWLTSPTTGAPFGYGDPAATQLPDMRNAASPPGYTGIYLRHNFTVNGPVSGNLLLRVWSDDGFVAWINGEEVDRRGPAPSTFVPYTAVAGRNHESYNASASTYDAGSENFTITTPNSILQQGTNVICIHALNETLSGSSDFWIDAELKRPSATAGGGPTPGAQNSVFSTTVPPAIRQVVHTPETPILNQPAILPGQAVSITAKVTDPDGVQSVDLLYQIVNPGSYIRKEDAAYELPANWITVSMLDNGGGTDLIPGDGIFTALIPAAVQTHRRLIRYRIQATDGSGSTVRVPYADDPSPNFAYFVYGAMPDYTGAINPAGAPAYTGGVIPSHTNTPVTYPAGMLQQLPTFQLITTRQNHVDSQYIPGTTLTSEPRGDENPSATDEQSYPWRGTLFYDGKVYDHIRFRARGGIWRYSMGKNMWKFDMMRGHDLQTKDNWGRARDEKWKKLNFSAVIQQGDFNNRGEQGLFEAVGFRLFQLSGMPANHTNFAHFRIIEHASETGPTPGQYDDDFQGLYLAIEQEDGQFLKEHGLPDGNLYKMEGTSGELNNQGPTQPKDKSDLNTFLAYSTQESWWRANAVLPEYYSYRAIVDCIHHYDIGDGKNYFYYHYPTDPLDSNSNKWQQAVWDLDLIWADNMYRGDSGIAGLSPSTNTTEPFFSRVWPILPLRTEMRNRHREILDLLWNLEQTGMLLDEYASFIYQPGVPSFAAADRAMWDYNPILEAPQTKTHSATKGNFGRFYQSAVDDPSTTGVNEALAFPGMMQKMRTYINTRRTVITTQILGDESAIPSTPVVTRAGGAAVFPTNDLTFNTTAYSSPSSRPFAKMKWRIAEVTNPNAPGYNRWDHTVPRKYEADKKNTWESPEITVFNNTYTFPAAAAHPGSTYRVRVKYADAGDAANGATPRWSHWSAPVTFTATAPDVSVYLSSLVVSEVMYHPRVPAGAEIDASSDKDDYEYIVVMNAGAAPLDMTNIRFTKGLDFDFAGSAVTTLLPGERAVVVKNLEAFSIRYASRLPDIRIAGAWQEDDNLSNGGEQIKLSFGAGVTVRDFTYGDEAPWPAGADGGGYSLVLIAPWTIPNHALPVNWRLSAALDGGPGQYDGQRFANWKTTHGQSDDLGDGEGDGVSNVLEYALFGNPATSSQSLLPAGSMELFDDELYLTLTVRVNRGADDVILIPERSTDLAAWDSTPAGVTLAGATEDANGGTTYQWRSSVPLDTAEREYLRLKVQLR